VNENDTPFLTDAGALITKWVAVAGVTVTAPLVPVTAPLILALTVTVWLPAVFSVTPAVKMWTPLSAPVPVVKV
jgi:hypothetical protein